MRQKEEVLIQCGEVWINLLNSKLEGINDHKSFKKSQARHVLYLKFKMASIEIVSS